MSKYIKYKRISKLFEGDIPNREKSMQDWLDEIITDGYDIVHYNETTTTIGLFVVMIIGKPNIFN